MPLPAEFHDIGDNDDDFQSLTPIPYLTQTAVRTKSVGRNGTRNSQRLPLKSCNGGGPKRRKRILEIVYGKENKLTCEDKVLDGQRSADCVDLTEDFSDVEIRLDSDENCSSSFVDSCPVYPSSEHHRDDGSCSNTTESEINSSWLNTRAVETCSLSVFESTLDPKASVCEEEVEYQKQAVKCTDTPKAIKSRVLEKEPLKCKQSYLCNSIESRLLNARNNFVVGISSDNLADTEFEKFEPGTQLNELLSLCSDEHQLHSNVWVASEFNQPNGDNVNVDDLVCCPLCGCDLSELNEETRLVHTNECLDNMETENVSTR